MASHGYPPALVLQPELGLAYSNMKACKTHLPTPDITRYLSPRLKPNPCEESRNSQIERLDYNKLVNVDFTAQRPKLIDVQSNCPNPLRFGFGIVEQCSKHDKILQFLKSGNAEAGITGENISLLLDLMNFQLPGIDETQQPFSSLIYPNSKLYVPKPLVDFVQDLDIASKLTVHPDGHITFTGSGIEMKDLLSVVAESYLSKRLHKGEKMSMLVPNFSRVSINEAEGRSGSSISGIESTLTAPLKSPAKVKVKPSYQKNKRSGRDQDLYRRNSTHACESLLSLMVDKSQRQKTAILSLKKFSPELSELLMQFSAAIAGTGLAILLSVICDLACGRVPIFTSKVLNTGIGFALVWLSWSVNKLRATIVSISKNTGKLGSKEEDMIKKLDESIGEIYWSAASVFTAAMLRLA